MNDIINSALSNLNELNSLTKIIIAFAGMILETSFFVGLLIPGESIALITSMSSKSLLFSIFLCITLITGSLIGQSIGYLIGKYLGKRIRTSKVGRKISEENWVKSEIFIEKRGGTAVFISRFLPFLHSVTPLSVGMSKMRYKKFIFYSALASFIWSIAYTSIGYFAYSSYEKARESIHNAGYIFIGIVISFIFSTWIIKKVMHKIMHKEIKKHINDTKNSVDNLSVSSEK